MHCVNGKQGSSTFRSDQLPGSNGRVRALDALHHVGVTSLRRHEIGKSGGLSRVHRALLAVTAQGAVLASLLNVLRQIRQSYL